MQLSLARAVKSRPRRTIAVVLAALVATGGTVAVANAVVTVPNTTGLKAVGPLSQPDGFPVWYKDTNDVKLALCVDPNDPACGAAAPLPDPNSPPKFPDNWPDEAFYQLADAVVTSGNVKARWEGNLEAAFAAGPVKDGDQTVFARLRLKVSGLDPNLTYRFTHPYGVDEIKPEADGTIFFTEDTPPGTPGAFDKALSGRVGPFLKWDATAPAAAAGTIGDGVTLHGITGSPFNTNFFKVESLDSAGKPTEVAFTDQFALQGKLATNGGVNVARATASGSQLDVFATSDTDPQAIEVTGKGINPTILEGENGLYLAHIDVAGALPAEVTVRNLGDTPVTEKIVSVSELVTASAAYDVETNELTISGSGTGPLTAGYGAVTSGKPATVFGTFDSGAKFVTSMAAPPDTVTVTSSLGGSAIVPVTVTGPGFPAEPVFAAAVASPSDVQAGATVTLDGASSSGPVSSWAWTQGAGTSVDLSAPSSPTTTFVAPSVSSVTTLEFTLAVSGVGSTSTSTVSVTVHPKASAPAPVANIAKVSAPLTQASTVTLDATGSTGATAYSWAQTAGPKVTLTPVAPAAGELPNQKMRFVVPKGDPTNPNVDLNFAFTLTATGPGGESTATTGTLATAPDTLTIQQVLYTVSKSEWRVRGADNILGPGITTTSTLTRGGVDVASLGQAPVDVTGAWSLRTSPTPAGSVPRAGDIVRVKSSSGGVATLVVTIK